MLAIAWEDSSTRQESCDSFWMEFCVLGLSHKVYVLIDARQTQLNIDFR